MFIREKIETMKAAGAKPSEIKEFTSKYEEGISRGKTQAKAMQFAEAHFGGPGSGRYPAGSGGEDKKLKGEDRDAIANSLYNDESSSDKEMHSFFVKEHGLSKGQADKAVSLRSTFRSPKMSLSLQDNDRAVLKKAGL